MRIVCTLIRYALTRYALTRYTLTRRALTSVALNTPPQGADTILAMLRSNDARGRLFV